MCWAVQPEVPWPKAQWLLQPSLCCRMLGTWRQPVSGQCLLAKLQHHQVTTPTNALSPDCYSCCHMVCWGSTSLDGTCDSKFDMFWTIPDVCDAFLSRPAGTLMMMEPVKTRVLLSCCTTPKPTWWSPTRMPNMPSGQPASRPAHVWTFRHLIRHIKAWRTPSTDIRQQNNCDSKKVILLLPLHSIDFTHVNINTFAFFVQIITWWRVAGVSVPAEPGCLRWKKMESKSVENVTDHVLKVDRHQASAVSKFRGDRSALSNVRPWT